MKILIINIKELVGINELNLLFVSGSAMGKLHTIKNAFLFIEKGLILEFGSMEHLFIPEDWKKKGINFYKIRRLDKDVTINCDLEF